MAVRTGAVMQEKSVEGKLSRIEVVGMWEERKKRRGRTRM
jgi:hypothetical protein